MWEEEDDNKIALTYTGGAEISEGRTYSEKLVLTCDAEAKTLLNLSASAVKSEEGIQIVIEGTSAQGRNITPLSYFSEVS